jgi:hypothetical protein
MIVKRCFTFVKLYRSEEGGQMMIIYSQYCDLTLVQQIATNTAAL